MFTNFTWWQFFGTFLIGAFIYYPIIIYVFFREQLSLFWRRSFVQYSDAPHYNDTAKDVSAVADTDPTPPLSDAALTGLIADLMEDIRNGVKAAQDSLASKDQLLALLKNILAKYPPLKKSAQRVQINEFIIQVCSEANYIIHMAQVYALWANATGPNE
jgi:hypothetical protein